MIYSHEVEQMCKVAQGVTHPGRSKMGKSQRDQGHIRSDSWCWLVCTSAGCLQTDTER